MECRVLALDPVGLAADARARPSSGSIDEHERPVGQQPAGREQVQLEHLVDAEAAGDPLVGDGAVDVAVEQHVGARARAPGAITSATTSARAAA